MRLRAIRVAVLCLLPGACALPLTLEAGPTAADLNGFPVGTELVEQSTVDGRTLRGVFVPAADARALVLHLLPRGYSATGGHPVLGGYEDVLETLQQAGCSSLVLDYRGVGASERPLDPRALPADVAAMWSAAQARAGALPIVVRAGSLGSLAWAITVQDGAAPAAYVLAAPIDAGTLLGNALRERFGSVLGTFLVLFHVAPEAPDLADAIAACPAPGLLLIPAEDPLFPPNDRDAAIAALPPRVMAVVVAEDHVALITRFMGFSISSSGGRIDGSLLEVEARFWEAFLAGKASELPSPAAD